MKMEPAPTVPVYGIVVEKDVDVADAGRRPAQGRRLPAG